MKIHTIREYQETGHNLWNFDSISALIFDERGTVEPLSLHKIVVHLDKILSGAPFENIISMCFRLQSTLIIFRSRENSSTDTYEHQY